MVGSLQVIHTAGHTPGHISLYSEKHKTVFGADSLFKSVLGMDGLEWMAYTTTSNLISNPDLVYYSHIKQLQSDDPNTTTILKLNHLQMILHSILQESRFPTR